MDSNQMRLRLMDMYGPSWKAKVQKMSNNQVLAVYRKFQQEGKIK